MNTIRNHGWKPQSSNRTKGINNMKIIVFIMTIILLCNTLAPCAKADSFYDEAISYNIYVNYENAVNAVPVYEYDSTYQWWYSDDLLPLRLISEAIGATVSWNIYDESILIETDRNCAKIELDLPEKDKCIVKDYATGNIIQLWTTSLEAKYFNLRGNTYLQEDILKYLMRFFKYSLTINREDKEIHLTSWEKGKLIVLGEEVDCGNTPLYYPGPIPLRKSLESLGAKVIWVAEDNSIQIINKTYLCKIPPQTDKISIKDLSLNKDIFLNPMGYTGT